MKTLASVIGVLAMGGTMAVSAVAPAQAQNVTLSFGQRYQVIETYCDRNPRDRDCRGFYDGGWRDSDYDRFYNSRRSSVDSISSGLFGLTFGAALGAIIANGNNNNGNSDRGSVRYSGGNYDAHVRACFNRYRSYDEETNSFMGYDGVRHECTL